MRGNGSVYSQKGTQFLWLQYYVKGVRVRESSGTSDPEKAREMLAHTLERVRNGKPATDPAAVTIGDLVDDLLDWYLTENPRAKFRKDTESRWELHLKKFFSELKASELGTAQLREYRKQRTRKGAALATINRELQIIRKAYKLAAECEPPKVLRVPKFKGSIPKEKNARKVFYDQATVQQLNSSAAREGLWARAFLEMSLTLGWRPNELFGLAVGNVRMAERALRIEDSKNGEPREVPLTEALLVLLQPLILGRSGDEPLFPVKSFRGAWKRICKRAGVPYGRKGGFILYDSRRTSARNKRAAGVSESVIMDIQGWKTSAMFRRYGIVDQADRLRALHMEGQFLSEIEQRMKQAKQMEMFDLGRTLQPEITKGRLH